MKKAIYFLVSLGVVWGSYCMAATASSPQLPAPLSSNQVRIGLGLAGEYINAGANLKVKPENPSATNLPSAIASNQSHLGRAFQIAPCIEFGVIIAREYYLGLHASWRVVNISNKSVTPIRGSQFFSHEFKTDQYIDVLFKPGYKLTPCAMIYGLVGPTSAKWSHITDEINERGNRLIDRFRTDRKSVGIGLGLGFEYLFKEKYAFSFDYTHHFHRSVSQTQNITILDGGAPRSGNINKKVHPSYGTFAVRFTVFFNL